MTELLLIVLAVVGGFLAGVINTLAGNGSAITLSIMTEWMGLPGNVANGTNRIGVFSQCATGAWAFHRGGKLDLRKARPYIFLLMLGALPGIWLALVVSHEQFRMVFGYLLVAMLGVILVKPQRWLIDGDGVQKVPNWIAVPVLVAMGFYGGFIQMGLGIFFLALMVLGQGFDLIRANAIKVVVMGLFTGIALVLFAWRGLIDWRIGLIIASGQALGGYLTARYASLYPAAKNWAYRLLIVVVIGSILRIFLW
jgi:uncharacterized membrane protein YfcA